MSSLSLDPRIKRIKQEEKEAREAKKKGTNKPADKKKAEEEEREKKKKEEADAEIAAQVCISYTFDRSYRLIVS
jgi:DnaJ homolog subfamily C member 2